MTNQPLVRLVSATPDAEKLIAYCARVSNPNNQDNPNATKLIRYCLQHKHFSIFEMANVVMEINTTRAIAAQIIRHRSFSFQEFSQRYAPAVAFAEAPELRGQDKTNRQKSIPFQEPSEDFYKALEYQTRAQVLFDGCRRLYEEMLENGIAKECARNVLPLATPTRLYMNGTVRSWLHYLDLRIGNGTQLEHQRIALAAKDVLASVVPNVCDAMWSS